mmetsp:Transcript_126267/g.393077  ORF Transcript_126267/g.393077 Transcript_126267/m.393077 type:complete len:313 (-) Transcript_126267:297-1235(-)
MRPPLVLPLLLPPRGHEHRHHHGGAPLPALVLVEVHDKVLHKVRGGLDVLRGEALLARQQNLHEAPAAFELQGQQLEDTEELWRSLEPARVQAVRVAERLRVLLLRRDIRGLVLQPRRGHHAVVQRHKARDATLDPRGVRPGLVDPVKEEQQPVALHGLTEHEEAVGVRAVDHTQVPVHEPLCVVGKLVLGVGLLQAGADLEHRDEHRQQQRRVAEAVHDELAQEGGLAGARFPQDEGTLEEDVAAQSFVILSNESLDLRPEEGLPAGLVGHARHGPLEDVCALARHGVDEGVLGLREDAVPPNLVEVCLQA